MHALIGILGEVLRTAPGWAARLADASVKISVLLLAAALAAAALRTASAGLRHLLWSVAIAAVLLLPVLTVALPGWAVPLIPATASAAPSPEWEPVSLELATDDPAVFDSLERLAPVEALATPPARAAWARLLENPWFAVCLWLMAMWASGAALVLLKLLYDHARMYALAMRATPIDSDRKALADAVALKLGLTKPVRLLESAEVAVPMVWGFGSPVVLLPEPSKQWPASRLELVLLHELAHVKRGDPLTQLMAQLACALYWFHPMVWFAARRMRQLREYACDDTVLSQGALPSDYATELLALVRAIENERLNPASVGMAQKSQLYQRVTAILDPQRARQSLARGRIAMVIAAAMVLVPLAALVPTADAAAGGALPRLSKEELANRRNRPIVPILPVAVVPQVPEEFESAREVEPARAVQPVQRPVQGKVAQAPSSDCNEETEAPADATTDRVVTGVTYAELQRATRSDAMRVEASRQEVIRSARELPDEMERARVLHYLLYNAPITEATGRAMLDAVAAMRDPKAIFMVLPEFMSINEADMVRAKLGSKYLDVAQKLPNGLSSEVLMPLLHPHELGRATTLRALKLVRLIPDATHRLMMLREVADHQRIDGAIDAEFRAVVATLPEDERPYALEALDKAKTRGALWAFEVRGPDKQALDHQLEGLREQQRALRAQEQALRQRAEELEKAADRLETELEKHDEAVEAAEEAADDARDE